MRFFYTSNAQFFFSIKLVTHTKTIKNTKDIKTQKAQYLSKKPV